MGYKTQFMLVLILVISFSVTKALVKIFNGGLTTVVVTYDDENKMERCSMKMEKEENTPTPVPGFSRIYVTKKNIVEMEEIIQECHKINDSDVLKDKEVDRQTWSAFTLFRGILPGTLWCGRDDIAENYDDLGEDKDLDKCCRTHDHCPLRIPPTRYRFGLINFSLYTKSHCVCDEELYKCLKRRNTAEAEIAGNFFFNFLRVQCVNEVKTTKCISEIGNSCLNSTKTKYRFVNPKIKW